MMQNAVILHNAAIDGPYISVLAEMTRGAAVFTRAREGITVQWKEHCPGDNRGPFSCVTLERNYHISLGCVLYMGPIKSRMKGLYDLLYV